MAKELVVYFSVYGTSKMVAEDTLPTMTTL